MKPLHRRLTPVLIVAAACAGPQDQPTAPTADLALGQGQAPIYMVTFRPEVTDVDGLTLELAGRHGFAVAAIRRHAARGFTAAMPDARADQVRNDPRVLIVERDGPVQLIQPIVDRAKPGGGGGSGGEETPWGITRVGGSQTYTGSNRAWVLDTGIDQDHPDLNVDQTCTASFAGGNGDDKNGHGTHVAGTIGAIKGNGIGVVGVAAGVRLCAVQVLGAGGTGSWSGVVAGVDYVAANGANGDVANMSLGGAGSNATLENAIKDAGQLGIRFALAAGNESTNAGTRTPARTNGTNIYTISAIGSNGCFASFSNYGNPPVDFAAPGVGVKSTFKGGGYKTYSGTSMATPHVAGLLLFGTVKSDGTACNDPDGNADPIAHR